MLGAGVRVLVVGAGIAGLAAARTRRAWGAAVEIVERQLEPGEGTGTYLLGNAVRALDTRGSVIRWPNGLSTSDGSGGDYHGRALFEIDVDQLWDGVGPCLALPRTDLHRVLLAGVVISLHQVVER
jgi:FAD-dependent urate hydroxylase